MARPPKDVWNRIEAVRNAWERLRPHKSFAGITLDEFKAAITPCLNAREELATLERRTKSVLEARYTADSAVFGLMQRIVHGVRADPEEGDDGALYGAMGYVRRSMRNTGLTRRRPDQSTRSKKPASDGSAPP